MGGLWLYLHKSFLLLENVYVVRDLKRNLNSVNAYLNNITQIEYVCDVGTLMKNWRSMEFYEKMVEC